MISGAELEKTVVNLAGAKVLVVGDLMLDTYMIGNAARISPEAPVPVIQLAWVEDRPGGAANTAMNISALGGEPVILGAIGPDDAGRTFMDILTANGFNDEGIFVHDDISTIRKTRVVAGNQQIVRIDDEEVFNWQKDLVETVFESVERMVPEVDAIAVSDYAKGFLTGKLMTKLNDTARMHNVPILVDPKPVNAVLFKGCDLLKPNKKEASELSGIEILDDASCNKAAAIIMNEFSPRALLITRGSDGMDLYRIKQETVRIAAHISQVFDVSGAGDTVLAMLAIAYAKKVDPEIACELASYAAGVAVRKPGTSVVTADEVIKTISMS